MAVEPEYLSLQDLSDRNVSGVVMSSIDDVARDSNDACDSVEISSSEESDVRPQDTTDEKICSRAEHAEIVKVNLLDDVLIKGELKSQEYMPKRNGIRPPLSSTIRAQLMARIGSKANVLYPVLKPGQPLVYDLSQEQHTPHSGKAGSEELLNSTTLALAQESAEDPTKKEHCMSEDEKRQFYKLHGAVNYISANPPSYGDCCTSLNVDIADPVIDTSEGTGDPSPFKLRPWQVQFLPWGRFMEQGPLGGFLLADEMGLGKTISALMLFHLQTGKWMSSTDNIDRPAAPRTPPTPERSPALSLQGNQEEPSVLKTPTKPNRVQHPNDGITPTRRKQRLADIQKILAEIDPMIKVIQKQTYRPILVLGPSNALAVWKDETQKHLPNLTLKLWYGNAGMMTGSDKRITLPHSITGFVRWIHSLPDSPIGARNMVLSSYDTFQARALYSEEGLVRTMKQNDFGEDLDSDAGEGDNLPHWKNYLTGVFHRAIMDEAQKIQSRKAWASHAVRSIKPRVINMYTATPMINRPSDLLGLLKLLWRKEWEASWMKPTAPTVDDYASVYTNEFEPQLNKNMMFSTDDIERNLWILNPARFEIWSWGDRNDQFMTPAVSKKVIPPILTVLQLRRTMSTVIKGVPGEEEKPIGAQIPPAKWTTVELGMSPRALEEYMITHKECESRLGGGYDEKAKAFRGDAAVHRQMCISTFNPELRKMWKKSKSSVKKLEALRQANEDYGAAAYFTITRPE